MKRMSLMSGTTLGSALLVGSAAFCWTAAAWAQEAAALTALPSESATATPPAEDIVVTGTLFRRTRTETASPVTVLTAESLRDRGVNSITQAVQTLSSNNAGTIPNSWNAGGSNFASGGSGISLRGLNSSYTLVLVDGVRMAYYPYADDGARNFVDTNAIPEAIIDRIEVLRDGASSTYGADAVAGVVNIITKKQITGLHINGSGGISQRGAAGEQRVDATWGYGSLSDQGFNVYVSAEYQHNSPLFARDAPYPWNTADQSGICGIANGQGTVAAGAKTCRTNGIRNGIQYDGTFAGQQATRVPLVRRYVAPAPGTDPILGTTTPVEGSRYELLRPELGCQGLKSVTLAGDQLTSTHGNNGATASALQCQEDLVNEFYALEPEQRRLGGTARLTVNVGSNSQAYLEANFFQATQHTSAQNYSTSSNSFTTAAGSPAINLFNATLPVYICPRGTTVACTASNGQLNWNNPFASLGLSARVLYLFPKYHVYSRARTYRGAAGLSGTFGGDWQYSVDAVASHIDTVLTYKGVIHAGHYLDVIADGSFNWLNPAGNSQATWDYLTPENRTPSHSDLYQVQGSLAHSFFSLPGGPVQIGVGMSARYESDHWNSSNPVDSDDPRNRYDATINGVGAIGHRYIQSGYFEVNAPVLKQLEFNGSGRYDHYSTGQSAFSPKLGAKFTPISQIALRGTWSKGFRIPSFNQSFGLPTTGYVGGQVTASTPGAAAFFAAHNNDSYATDPYTYGQTQLGNPDLKPERSRNITLGIVAQPTRWLSLTADYYNIRVKNLVTPADTSAVLAQYYGNNGVVNIPGVTVIPGAPDPLYPNALPLIGFIQSSFKNADYSKTSGLDFSAEARIPIAAGIRLTSSIEATRLLRLETVIGGVVQRYDGTLSPCQTTSCSGAPRWRGNWQNTLELGAAKLSTTIYYTSGYGDESIDYGAVRGDCSSVAVYRDTATPVQCRTKRFINTDMTASYEVGEHLTMYLNVLNVFNVKPPYDPNAAYGAPNYNPAWAQAGIKGRYFRIGARADF